MFISIHFASTFLLALAFFLLTPKHTPGQERLCDPSFEDCYSPLLDLVNSETVGIDMAFYMIELPGLANAIIITRRLLRQAWTTHRWDTRPTRRP